LTAVAICVALAPMSRPLRIEFAGAVYHVMARGNQGQKICADDGDREMWVSTLVEARTLELGIKAGRKELEVAWKSLRRGWYVGGADFRKALLAWVDEANSGKGARWQRGGALRPHDQSRAEELIEAGLGLLGLEQADLVQLPKGQMEKLVLAWWLYGRTTVTRRWLADQLAMGFETRISQAVKFVQVSREPSVNCMKAKLLHYNP
jgi:hypothetical protein